MRLIENSKSKNAIIINIIDSDTHVRMQLSLITPYIRTYDNSTINFLKIFNYFLYKLKSVHVRVDLETRDALGFNIF